MIEFDGVELVGYVASALVVLSLAMTSVVRLRSISLAGSVTFVVYGVFIESVPIIATNAAIAALNVWFLRTELGMHRDLGVTVVRPDSPFLIDFITFHREDIRRFQPRADVAVPLPDDALALILTRDGLPAGALVGVPHATAETSETPDELEIVLDYVLKPYRDSRLGSWLFGPGAKVFRDAGYRRLVTRPGDDTHRSYLERMGFRREANRYTLELDGRP